MHKKIPQLHDESLAAMNLWFAEMADAELIFHPEDTAESLVFIEDGKPFFSSDDANRIQEVLDGFFERFGCQAVNDSACPHFMRAAGMM